MLAFNPAMAVQVIFQRFLSEYMSGIKLDKLGRSINLSAMSVSVESRVARGYYLSLFLKNGISNESG